MSSFDPTAVRKAVEEFTPRRPQKFQDLLPAKDVITELRQKRASYRSIADLLTQHCLPTSKTAIAVFCHQVLGLLPRAGVDARHRAPASPLKPKQAQFRPASGQRPHLQPPFCRPERTKPKGLQQTQNHYEKAHH